jgi:beta-1,4-mannosyl-glycoprotein beta-1,4-N-acetylglucosaminyltransferase
MIFDCFPFYNELDLLELRLCELDDVVDRFVVVEATVTHAGHPKPLFFAENSKHFSEWSRKIIHVVVDDMPSGPDPWLRENHQRNAIVRGLHDVAGDDGIIISDADEIPSADAVRCWTAEMGACAFEQLCSYYWINCVGGGWAGSRILPFRDVCTFSNATAIRHAHLPLLSDGGWHFSFVGGWQRVAAKLEAYAHQDLNQSRFKDPKYLAIVMGLGIDLFGRAGMHWQFCPVDARFPKVIREHPERFSNLLCDAAFHEDWYPNDQIFHALAAYERTRALHGAVVEIGCWEGKLTIALANACHPDALIAVDTWTGSAAESPDHVTVHLARQRDVFAQFQKNVRLLTSGNVVPTRRDVYDFLAGWSTPLKFVHIDASHDYRSVRHTLEVCLRWILPGGVLCGDDFQSADMNRRDLDGGVERAVRELLPGFEQIGNFWCWQRKGHA